MQVALDIFQKKLDTFDGPLWLINATFLGDDLITACRLGAAMKRLEEVYSQDIKAMIKNHFLYACIFRHFSILHNLSQTFCHKIECQLKKGKRKNYGGYNLGVSHNLPFPSNCFDGISAGLVTTLSRYVW